MRRDKAKSWINTILVPDRGQVWAGMGRDKQSVLLVLRIAPPLLPDGAPVTTVRDWAQTILSSPWL